MRRVFFSRVLCRFRHSLYASVALSSLSKRPVVLSEFYCRAISSVEPMIPSQPPTEAENPLKRRTVDSEESNEDFGVSNRERRRQRRASPAYEASKMIYAATKRNDRTDAMERFRIARDAGVQLPQSVMNSILYLLVGGEGWLEKASAAFQSDAASIREKEDLEQCRDEVLEYMRDQDLLQDEMVSIIRARIAVSLGDPDGAFVLAKQMLESTFPPRLRFFTPALLGFAEQGETNKAMQVQHVMDESGLDLTELEFRLLLKAYAQSAVSYREIDALLRRMGKELTFLEKDTIDVARSYFTSENSQNAFQEGALSHKQMWMVEDVTVDSEGFSLTSGENLSASDLSKEDWELFLKASAKLAASKAPKQAPFQDFVEWMQRHGPFPLVIDAANVAFHKQNYEQGAFSFQQIQSLIDLLQETFPGRKILLVLHYHRKKNKRAKEPLAEALLKEMDEKKQLCVTPAGANDDWYWLYAALHAREQGLLISNDECRDHIFQLLAPKYFLKWKERHLVRFEFVDGVPTIQLPSHYTCCTQQLTNGTWMLPYRDDEEQEKWLCAKAL